jgi:pantoate--beta-alanine ligase
VTTVIEHPQALFERCETERRAQSTIGFVPTMGALHDGHMSLVERARSEGCRCLMTSIFVNPMQFGPNEDFTRYPRTFDDDLARCRAHGVDVVYAPAPEVMYPSGFSTSVDVTGLTSMFEGEFRPTHFRGVATVVTKLLTAVGACTAVFGRKDYQQWRVIERLVRDLGLPVQVIGAPVLREADGLAMSSRNRYLSVDDRRRALAIVSGLRAAWDEYSEGERDAERLAALARSHIEPQFDKLDYVACAHPERLTQCKNGEDRFVLLVAAHVGKTRLIDNVELGIDPRP